MYTNTNIYAHFIYTNIYIHILGLIFEHTFSQNKSVTGASGDYAPPNPHTHATHKKLYVKVGKNEGNF